MEIVNEFPPNIEKIKAKFGDKEISHAVFTYGDKIYNPQKFDIQDHVVAHEQVHRIQQEEIGVEAWWDKYLNDSKFRLEQELEAYSVQYRFIRSRFNNKSAKWFLEVISRDLSSPMYGNIVSSFQASTMIRKWTKEKRSEP